MDPTRPAPAWLAAQPQVPGALAVEQKAAPTLQLLLLGQSRKYTIIDGQIVQPGDTYHGSTLVAIKPDAVVLQNNDTLQTLKMYPNIEPKMHPNIKKTVITPTSVKTGRSVSKGNSG